MADDSRLKGEYRSDLTPREKQVVLYLCLGMKEAAVARELGICPATVHSHITRVHRKLDVQSRGLLVAVAIVRGVICVSDLARLLNGTADCETANTA